MSYQFYTVRVSKSKSYRFRPLPRWIGSFTLGFEKNIDVSIYAFPSPREVDRVFYDKPEFTVEPEGVMFPSPTEVNTLFYAEIFGKVIEKGFPSPTEVDRLVYSSDKKQFVFDFASVSVPSRGG